MRSTTVSSVSRSCVTRNTVMPRSSTSDRTIASNPRAVVGSSPEVGSSRKSTSGSSARARAIAARLRIPPDSSLGIFGAASGSSPACASRRWTSALSMPLGTRACSVSGTATFSATVSDENNAPSWNIMPKRRRVSFISSSLEFQTSVPSRRMRPPVGRCRPMISRNRTDLPVPLPPIRATSVPLKTSKLTPSCTTCSPKRVTMSSTSIDRGGGRHQISSSWNSTAKAASSRITATMLCTTVDVVAMPSDRVSRRTVIPMWQPISAMKSANTGAFASPT